MAVAVADVGSDDHGNARIRYKEARCDALSRLGMLVVSGVTPPMNELTVRPPNLHDREGGFEFLAHILTMDQ